VDIAAGNLNAKDWQDEARQIIERTVSCLIASILVNSQMTFQQMALYYKNWPLAATCVSSSQVDSSACNNAPTLSEFDKHCESLLSNDSEESWASELWHYLGDMEQDVKKDMDILNGGR